MDIMSLMKAKKSVRLYKRNKPIPQEVINKIVEAGIWGPSIFNTQVWKFVVITNKELIAKIANITQRETKKLYVSYRFLMKRTSKNIDTSQALIIVYNTNILKKRMSKFGKKYEKCMQLSEVQSIAAAIQNMLLIAESMNVSSIWLTLPLLCKNSINKLLNTNDELIAILAFGYSDGNGVRAKRKKKCDMLRCIE